MLRIAALYLISTMSRPSSTSTPHHTTAPTVPPLIHSLASPLPTLIDAHLPSYLLPHVLTMLRDSSRHVVQRKIAQEEALREEGLLPARNKGKGKMTREEEELVVETEALKRVERMGLMVGGFIAEKWVEPRS